jgi:AraC-like DNA-binding protein
VPGHASNLDKVLFASARKILRESLASAPNLSELATAVGTNTRRLNEAFKHCAGATVFDYLRELRLSEARRLLAESALPVQQIASHCGYSNQANFSTAFRERFGLTPSDFRRESEPHDARA